MLNTASSGELRQKDKIRALSSSSRQRKQISSTLVFRQGADLLVSERDHGINLCRAANRNQRSQQSYSGQSGNNRGESGRIVRTHLKEHAPHQPRSQERNEKSSAESGGCKRRSVSHDQA